MSRILLIALRWIGGWIYYISLICSLGALLGTMSHLLFALLFVERADFSYYAALGLLHGLKYSSLWAGGLSIVLCVMKARREYLHQHSEIIDP